MVEATSVSILQKPLARYIGMTFNGENIARSIIIVIMKKISSYRLPFFCSMHQSLYRWEMFHFEWILKYQKVSCNPSLSVDLTLPCYEQTLIQFNMQINHRIDRIWHVQILRIKHYPWSLYKLNQLKYV